MFIDLYCWSKYFKYNEFNMTLVVVIRFQIGKDPFYIKGLYVMN